MSSLLEEISLGASLEGVPDWFNALRKAGRDRFNELPDPSRRDEHWRFGNIKKAKAIENVPITIGQEKFIELIPASPEVIRFTFLNGFILNIEGELPEGVFAASLERAFLEIGESLESHFKPVRSDLGSEKLAAFHQANLEDGMIVHIAPGVLVEQPIEIRHLVTEIGRSQTYLQISLGAGAEASVIESYEMLDTTTKATVISLAKLDIHEQASLKYLVTQELNSNSEFIRIGSSEAQTQSNATTAIIHSGSGWVRDEWHSTLSGKEANNTMLSLATPTSTQEVDQRTFQNHVSPHCYSNVLYKNALYDNAKTVFSGLIYVAEGAHHTDAYQTCRNLLMSDTCEANSMPGLEINADQVKCSHGSTSSQISEDETFYLKARGITDAKARQMIAEGFCSEVIQKLASPRLEEFALASLERCFQSIKERSC